MIMYLERYVIVFNALFVFCLCRDVAYHELETLGVSCKPHDTCNTTSANRNASRRNCECDNQCAYFGDCCMDAPNRNPSKSVMSTNLVCHKILSDKGYFVIGKCKRGWTDVETKIKCEGHPDPQDPFSFVPVTTTRTTFTYKNQYCAMCNNVPDTLLYWKLGVDCKDLNNTMENDVRRNFTYNRNISSWGVYIDGKFYSCGIKPVVPEKSRYLRFCYPNTISTCSPGWTDEFIRDKCESYTAHIHIRQNYISYRNVHCAICNNIRLQDLSCDSDFSRDFERTSFTTLFDINLAKGNSIGSGGTAPKCKKNEVYDPAFGRCQTVSCGLPFLELRNGSCVPKSRK